MPPLILALSGGGFRGYFTALVLARLEKLLGAPCHKVFSLIAGTSIGGIIAIGLAFGIAAETIAAIIEEFGPAIFPRRRFKNARRLLGPPYSPEPIVEALRRILPRYVNRPLGEALQNVMVIAVSPATARMEVLSSWDGHRTGMIAVKDAALATSAAPTYFPAHQVELGADRIELVDGGIAANAPDAVAIHQAVTELAFPDDRIVLLSIGTCAAAEGAAVSGQPSRAGLIGAVTDLGGRGIVNLMMAVQEQRGVTEGAARLGQRRYLRVDASPSMDQARFLELDDASVTSVRTLQALADRAYDQLSGQDHDVWRLLHARAQAVRP